MSSSTAIGMFEDSLTNIAAPPSNDGSYLDLVHELYLIIPNTELNAVLVVPGDGDGRVAFPVVEPSIREVDDWHTHPQELQRFVYEKLSVRLRVMFQESETDLPARNDNDSGVRVNLVCQLLDDSFTPSLPLRWYAEGEISKRTKQLRLSEDPLDSVYVEAEEVLRELKGFKSSYLNTKEPWLKMTWLSFISEWAKGILEKKGFKLVVGPVSVHYGSVSHTMGCKVRRVRLASNEDACPTETLYVKATVPEFGEVQRTVAIARECPDITGEVVAWDLKRGLMILRDAGSPSTHYLSPRAAFGTMQKLQSLSKERLKRLEDEGLVVRDAKWYLENIDGLLQAVGETDIVINQQVADALEYLTENVGTVKRMIRGCNKWNLPNVLVHGDMHPGNYGRFVKEGEGGYHKLFDWDRAFIGSPLADVSMALWEQTSRYRKPLICNFEEFDMPWKSLIPEDEWNVGFRKTTRVQYMLTSCEIMRHCLRAYEVCHGSFIWGNMINEFQCSVVRLMELVRKAKEGFMETNV